MAHPKLVTLAVAAEFVSVNPKTIRRRISDGTIKAYRLGPRILRVDLDEITAKLRPIPTGGAVPDRDDEARRGRGNRAGSTSILLGGGCTYDSTAAAAHPKLGPTAQRVIAAHQERPWPDLDAWLADRNRRALVAAWSEHLARVCRDPWCTSADVTAAVGRLLPLLGVAS